MIGMRTPADIIPFFWLNLAGLEFRYVGHPGDWQETYIDGTHEKEDFIVYYLENGRVNAALGANRDAQMAVIEELMRHNKMPDAHSLRENAGSLSAMQRILK